MTKYFNFEVNNMKKIEMYVNTPAKGKLPEQFNDENYKKVQEYHKSLAVYEPTPLVSLDALAEELGVKAVYLKDESKRFGLNAFKALGASYAVGNILKNMDPDKTPVFVTATDGNHGRAVAWAAAQAGYKSVVFMPKGTAQCRVDAIHQVSDAEVTVTDLNYDDAVRFATAYAKEHNGYLVQDTGFEGYEEIPWDITLGYTHMAAEAADQLGGITPTHVFLQAGVGSMAGGVLGYLTDRYGSGSFKTSIMEAYDAACIFDSVKQGGLVASGGNPETIMAGLNCGEANIFTFTVLRDFAEFFFKLPDCVTEEGMRKLSEAGVVAGECGAVGTGLLMNICGKEEFAEMKKQMGLDENSVVLLFSTEGNTDPDSYERIVKGQAADSCGVR